MSDPIIQLTRASNAHRRVRCPGSGWAEHGLEEADSEYSAEGTRLHKALYDAETYNSLSKEKADLVDLANGLRFEAIEKASAAFDLPADSPFTEGWEREVIARKGIRPILTGHIDYWRHYPKHDAALIWDAKFGFLETTAAPLNVQMLCYALGLWQELGVKRIAVAIGQPRAILDDSGARLSIARYDEPDLAAGLQALLAWEQGWLQPEAPRMASEDACRYCKAKLTCETFLARMVDLPSLSIDALPSLGAMDEQQFAQLYAGFRLASMEKIKDGIKAEALIRCAEGRLPGFAIEEGIKRRVVKDQAGAFTLMTDSTIDCGISAEEFAGCSKVSVGALEKVVRSKFGKKEKEAKAIVNAILKPVLTEEQNAPSIVAVEQPQLT